MSVALTFALSFSIAGDDFHFVSFGNVVTGIGVLTCGVFHTEIFHHECPYTVTKTIGIQFALEERSRLSNSVERRDIDLPRSSFSSLLVWSRLH